jgi:hypothetical protein
VNRIDQFPRNTAETLSGKKVTFIEFGTWLYEPSWKSGLVLGIEADASFSSSSSAGKNTGAHHWIRNRQCNSHITVKDAQMVIIRGINTGRPGYQFFSLFLIPMSFPREICSTTVDRNHTHMDLA